MSDSNAGRVARCPESFDVRVERAGAPEARVYADLSQTAFHAFFPTLTTEEGRLVVVVLAGDVHLCDTPGVLFRMRTSPVLVRYG